MFVEDMEKVFNFEQIYENYLKVRENMLGIDLGPAFALDNDALEVLLGKFRDRKQNYPDLAFWLLFDLRKWDIAESGGEEEVFGQKFSTLKSFLRLVHPDYLVSYLQWGQAAYQVNAKRL